MEDFYDSIKDNLENRPEPSFNEEAWKAMEGKLKDYEHSQARVVVWPWWSYGLLALLPLSILLNAWLFFQKTDNSKNSITAPTALVRSDTIVKTQLVYKTDTIIETRIIKQLVGHDGAKVTYPWHPGLAADLFHEADRFEWASASQEAVSVTSPASPKINLHQQANLQLLRAGLGPAASGSQNVSVDESRRTLRLLPMAAIRTLASQQPASLSDMNGLPISTFRYTPPPIWESLRPQAIAVGAQLGGLIPITRDIGDPHAFQRSIQVKLQLPNRWAVWGEFGLLDIKYLVQETGEKVDIPSVDPPAANFDFQHVQVWQERTHLLVGLEYAFAKRGRRARPTLAAGYNALGFKPYEIFYEFKDADTDTEIQVEQNIKRRDGPMHYLATKAGYQWPIGRRVMWDLSLHYRHGLNPNRYTNPHMVGLTTAFSVQF